MPFNKLYTSLLCQSLTLLYTSLLFCSRCSLAKVSDLPSGPFSGVLDVPLQDLSSLRQCLQLRHGFYEVSPLSDPVHLPQVHTNRNGVTLTLTSKCATHHYVQLTRQLQSYFSHLPQCHSLQLRPQHLILLSHPQWVRVETLLKVALSLTLLLTVLSCL
ncbi:GP2b protein [Kafue kinda chacma baboon virus]|uniref:GP2b protein n=1 Tax=Kafue kinda chacma baboon virus TaxID=1823757 RepID=A0A120HUW6_9NIDO|nr:GP2b protein [Kafue kinda chacma baboon virus]AMB20715.1 GP2b protein [Kafue kinda chacma baboon virus]AMV49338.1 GP2b protein [Kafue kinda chacma baboon virus]